MEGGGRSRGGACESSAPELAPPPALVSANPPVPDPTPGPSSWAQLAAVCPEPQDWGSVSASPAPVLCVPHVYI